MIQVIQREMESSRKICSNKSTPETVSQVDCYSVNRSRKPHVLTAIRATFAQKRKGKRKKKVNHYDQKKINQILRSKQNCLNSSTFLFHTVKSCVTCNRNEL